MEGVWIILSLVAIFAVVGFLFVGMVEIVARMSQAPRTHWQLAPIPVSKNRKRS